MNAPVMSSRYLIVLLACLALAGCAAPKSRQEMLAIDTGVTRLCTSLAVPEAAERLRTAWRSCFVKPPTFRVIPIGAAIAVTRSRVLFIGDEFNGGVTSLFVRIASGAKFELISSPLNGAILLMADIRETAECRAEVVVRPADDDWRGRAEFTSIWFQDRPQANQQPPCP